MLNAMRGRWITGLLVFGVGGVFVFFLGLQGPMRGSSTHTLVTVGSQSFGTREYERARARRTADLQHRLGAQFDARKLSDTLDQLAARDLVERALLAQEAEALGLTATKQEIQALVLADPSFRDKEGHFDEKAFHGFAQYEYGSENAFIDDERMGLLATKMIRLLNTQPRVSEGEARDAVRRRLESVRIAFVKLGDEPPDPKAVSDADVKEALEKRAPEIKALYDDRSAEFNTEEAVRVRHILFALPADADEAAKKAALQKAKDALAKIRAGADFAKLAETLSDDAGSKKKGGELGFIERGQMVPPFEKVAFALKPGEVSDPVLTRFGYHLIQVEEHRPAKHQPFDEVREQLARDLLAREVVEHKAEAVAEKLSAAVRAGQSLEQAAREQKLTLERSGLLTRRPDGYIPGLGGVPEMMATAFALKPGQSSPRIFEHQGKRALVQVLERKEPDDAQIDAQLETTRAQLLDEKRNVRTDAWVNERRQQLVSAGELSVHLPPSRE